MLGFVLFIFQGVLILRTISRLSINFCYGKLCFKSFSRNNKGIIMSGRPSRRRNRDFGSGRSTDISPSSARPSRMRSRSAISTDQQPDQLSTDRLIKTLKDHGLILPKSTPKSSLLQIFKQFTDTSSDNSARELGHTNSTSPGQIPNLSAQTNAQTTSERDRDISVLKQDVSQIQASLAEINRKLSNQRSQPAVMDTSATGISAGTTTPLTTGTVRVPIDTLPPVNIVSQNIRKLIHSHKYVNLALLLIPTVDTDSQTKIIDQEGNQIIVRANDARLQRNLSIHEFRTAFSRFKNVICEKEPERRKELDTYSDMIDSMFVQYGGTHFYEYHIAFARKAEQYFHLMDTTLDWSSRDSSLYMQIFAGLKSSTCDLCSSVNHSSKFCPLSITGSPIRSSRINSSAQPKPDVNSKMDKFGRTRTFHNGQEICNNFNSTTGCTYSHIKSKILHICSVCKQPSHASFECASKGKSPTSNKQSTNTQNR